VPTSSNAGLLVATTTADYLSVSGLGSADPVWLRSGARHRVRLIDLGWQR
jgi:hypothetical protein